jgi:hypothetical protein
MRIINANVYRVMFSGQVELVVDLIAPLALLTMLKLIIANLQFQYAKMVKFTIQALEYAKNSKLFVHLTHF